MPSVLERLKEAMAWERGLAADGVTVSFESLAALIAAAEALEGWLAYAEEHLGEFDTEVCETERLCRECQAAGCINLKIRETRAALAPLLKDE